MISDILPQWVKLLLLNPNDHITIGIMNILDIITLILFFYSSAMRSGLHTFDPEDPAFHSAFYE